MESLIKSTYDLIDRDFLVRETEKLTALELPQTFSAYKNSSEYALKLLKDEGFDAEILTFPADGKTAYQDKTMPLAWDATMGRLTVLKGFGFRDDEVLADYQKMPFSLIKHSVSTPKGGILAKVVTESQMYAGEDCDGKMVLLEPEQSPKSSVITTLLNRGAIGFISDEMFNPFVVSGDDRRWCNNASEENNWHVLDGARDFIGFSLSQKEGRKLRTAVNKGDVVVRVESDGNRHIGTLNAVTALLPGKKEKELWVMAHLYEPLANDNSSGVIGAIEVLRKVRELTEKGILPKQEFSVRVVFAMELYGFAAVAECLGGDLHERCLGAINMDALPIFKGENQNMFNSFLTPYSSPFFGNCVMETLISEYDGLFGGYTGKRENSFADDSSFNDSTVGLPTIWPRYANRKYWHCSAQDMSSIDIDNFAKFVSLCASWAAACATMSDKNITPFLESAKELTQKALSDMKCTSKEQSEFYLKSEANRILDFKRVFESPEIDKVAESLCAPPVLSAVKQNGGKWREYAKGFVPERLTRGLPYDFVNYPSDKRRESVCMKALYEHLSFILSAMDGKKNLLTLIEEAEWETGIRLSEEAVKKCIDDIMYLANGGYLYAEPECYVTKEEIKTAISSLGIKSDDIVLFHSSLSENGIVEGGADTVIDALLEALGNEATVLMPCFTRPYSGFDAMAYKRPDMTPFYKDTPKISTGIIPKTFVKREGVIRGEHATHAWCGTGKHAYDCLKDHKLLDPPVSKTSPLDKALKSDGKVVFYGCDISSNTFIHYIEDDANAIFLENAFVKIRDDNGRVRTEVIPRHLPGDRNFYNKPAINTKFYREAVKKGLKIKTEKVGIGQIYMMELKQLFEIGSELFKQDPLITLCDDPVCAFCSHYRNMLKKSKK